MSSSVGWETVSYSKKSSKNAAPPLAPKFSSQKSLAGRVEQGAVEEKKELQPPRLFKPPKVSEANPFRIVKNVHRDDIHCCLRLPEGFVTGSKDGSLKLWDFKGELISNVYDPQKINYQSWITALSRFGDHWLSGTRDSFVDQWSLEGEHISNLQKPSLDGKDKGIKCKQRNQERVNCLAQLQTDEKTYLVGRPTSFSVYQSGSDASLGTCKTSLNDWVYCLHPLKEGSVLTVTGARLDLYARVNESFKEWKRTSLVQEEALDRVKYEQVRPFISAITPLQGDEKLFGLAVFDGSVKVFDLVRGQFVKTENEHEHRVWTIANLKETSFASCADDGLVKIWDLRTQGSSATLQDNKKTKARVSVLLQVDENILLSGSCPDDLRHTDEKARLSFWDLRKI